MLKPSNPRQEQRELPTTLPIPRVYDTAYLQALQYLANDPLIPGPIFIGQKSMKKYGFVANTLLSRVEII